MSFGSDTKSRWSLLRYLYDVSFDMKLHVNEQSICNLYKLHNANEQYATVGVLIDLINCRDGIMTSIILTTMI